MKSSSGAKTPLATVSEVANDVRAKEWQAAHYELRNSLNEILEIGYPAKTVQELIRLRTVFSQRAENDLRELEQGISAITEAACREEFAQALRLSVELIRLKARSQVHKALADEVSGVLGTGSRAIDAPEEFIPEPVEARGKVIELRPRAARA